jgi:hypothetical protein
MRHPEGCPQLVKTSEFFHSVLGGNSGYLKIAGGQKQKKVWHLRLLKYPDELEQIETQISQWVEQGLNTYFSPHLFNRREAKEQFALPSNILCADLDTCPPGSLGRYGEPLPNIIIRTSRGRYQALWLLDENLEPNKLKALSKRLTMAYVDLGCDKSGYDIGQLLRIPGTFNFKYEKPQEVKVVKTGRVRKPTRESTG